MSVHRVMLCCRYVYRRALFLFMFIAQFELCGAVFVVLVADTVTVGGVVHGRVVQGTVWRRIWWRVGWTMPRVYLYLRVYLVSLRVFPCFVIKPACLPASRGRHTS